MSCCSLLSNGVAAAARPTPHGFPFPNPKVPMVFVHVDGKEASSARGSKYNEQVRPLLRQGLCGTHGSVAHGVSITGKMTPCSLQAGSVAAACFS